MTTNVSLRMDEELLVDLRRSSVPVHEIRETVEDYSRWRLIEHTMDTVLGGLTEMKRRNLSRLGTQPGSCRGGYRP